MIKLLDLLEKKMTAAQKKKRGEIFDKLVAGGMAKDKAGPIATSRVMEKATFTDEYDDDPKLKGGQKKLPDQLQKAILNKENMECEVCGGSHPSSDHEVSMAHASLKSIIKSAVTLLNKLGNEERNIPGWVQDHITNAENYIDQAAQGFHELNEITDQKKSQLESAKNIIRTAPKEDQEKLVSFAKIMYNWPWYWERSDARNTENERERKSAVAAKLLNDLGTEEGEKAAIDVFNAYAPEEYKISTWAAMTSYPNIKSR